jgi:hypothetical protein
MSYSQSASCSDHEGVVYVFPSAFRTLNREFYMPPCFHPHYHYALINKSPLLQQVEPQRLEIFQTQEFLLLTHH